MCREFEVLIVAEGVELDSDLAIWELGIPLAQGFLLGRPEPAFRLFDREPADLPEACRFAGQALVTPRSGEAR